MMTVSLNNHSLRSLVKRKVQVGAIIILPTSGGATISMRAPLIRIKTQLHNQESVMLTMSSRCEGAAHVLYNLAVAGKASISDLV